MNTIVMGAPGSGKTTWCRQNLGSGLMYDLDLIATALRGNVDLRPYEPRSRTFDEDARTVADQLLIPIVEAARRAGTDLMVIRTAPTAEELAAINPDMVMWIRSESAERMSGRYAERLAATADMIQRMGTALWESPGRV